MTIYEKLCKKRDDIRLKKDSDEKIKVLSQLMLKAFNNELHPDELPKRFVINNINCKSEEVLKAVFSFLF